VSLLINIEREMEDSLGIALTLANERALSMKESPFRTECERGIVPIGEPFDGMQALIVDEQLREVDPGGEGELLMTGPQLSLGYWQDESKTREMFVSVPDKIGIYYKTGDRVVRPAAPNKPLLYLGRLDSQVKVLGHRVELAEIEAAVREATGLDGVVALGWPRTESGADGIAVFLEADNFDTPILVRQLERKLPGYMLPRTVRVLNRFPLNTNGKYDRKALQNILEKESLK
jgi:acyl-coenzyme A synthetase/AMP-(fatty) acid ligase